MTTNTEYGILHSIDTGGPGGAETIFLELIRASGQFNLCPIAVAKQGDWLEEQLLRLNVENFCLNTKGSLNARLLSTLIQVVRKYNVKIIQSHLFGSNLYCSVASIITNTPLVSVFHGKHDLSGVTRGQSLKQRIVQRGSNAIVAVSESLKTELEHAGYYDKLTVIYNGIDLTRFKPLPDTELRARLGVVDGDYLVGAVGNIRKAKAYDVFIDAAADVASRNERVKFVVAGEGDDVLSNKLMYQVKNLGLDDRFIFLDHVADVERLYNNLDVFVSSSISEGFSLSCVEAMACGVPVVATRSGGPEEIVADGDSGRLVPAGESTALASTILEVLADSDQRRRYAREGEEVVKRRFGQNKMIRSYESLYESLLLREQ